MMEDIFIAWRILDFQILFTFPWQQLIVHMWLERATSKLENFRFGQCPFGGEFLVISGWKPLFCLCGKRPPSVIVFFSSCDNCVSTFRQFPYFPYLHRYPGASHRQILSGKSVHHYLSPENVGMNGPAIQ